MKPTVVILAAAAMGSLLAACSSSTNTNTPTATNAPANTVASTPTPTAVPTSAPAATPVPPAGGLSGNWTGQYSGAFSGTFTLSWQQAGATVTGQIVLSNPPNKTLTITGNEAGTAITFGAVGGVTYTGTVSGNSMSGTYAVPGSSAGGSWSANRA